MKYNTPAHLAVFKKEDAYPYWMIRSSKFSFESRLVLASSKSPKPLFEHVRRKREIKKIIVEQTHTAVLCEVLRSYFSPSFRKDGCEYSPLNYLANNHIHHFITSAEDLHWQLPQVQSKSTQNSPKSQAWLTRLPRGCRILRLRENLSFVVSSCSSQTDGSNGDPPQNNPLGGGVPCKTEHLEWNWEVTSQQRGIVINGVPQGSMFKKILENELTGNNL